MIFKQEIIAIIVCLVLAGTHVYAYFSGRDTGKRKFDEAIAEQSKKLAEAEAKNREIEQQLNQDRQKIEVRYVESKRKTAAVATNNLIQLDELRHELAARSKTAADSTTSCGVDGETERALFRACSETLVGMAREADEVVNKLSGLQAYVSLCQSQP